jgi:hypothetical protein
LKGFCNPPEFNLDKAIGLESNTIAILIIQIQWISIKISAVLEIIECCVLLVPAIPIVKHEIREKSIHRRHRVMHKDQGCVLDINGT